MVNALFGVHFDIDRNAETQVFGIGYQFNAGDLAYLHAFKYDRRTDI